MAEHTTIDIDPAEGLRVVVSSAAGLWQRVAPRGAKLVIGRDPDADVVVSDPSVSRRHAMLELDTPARVVDFGSRNGTRVLGRRLTPNEPRTLPTGCVAEIGGAMLVVLEDAEPTGGSIAPTSTGCGGDDPIVAEPSMQRLYALLDIIAPSPLAVLVLGETGTGKEVFARELVRRSARANKPFITLNCATLTESLLESELFGHERGAFTGATGAKQGLLETADKGTLFLDEIGELPLATQAKLLRVLQSGELLRVGGVHPTQIDVRLVSATNRDLEECVASGAFRADLFYRINGFVVTIPPLRERPADILPLARQAVRAAAEAAGKAKPKLTRAVLERLSAHPWPGNVRELRAVIERAVVLARGRSELSVDDLMLTPARPSQAPPAGGDERARIVLALARANGNQTEAARLLGVSRKTLSKWLDHHRIGRPRKG